MRLNECPNPLKIAWKIEWIPPLKVSSMTQSLWKYSFDYNEIVNKFYTVWREKKNKRRKSIPLTIIKSKLYVISNELVLFYRVFSSQFSFESIQWMKRTS